LARFWNNVIQSLQTFNTTTMSTQKIFAGALTGLVAGVALGMLTAPAKGSETRQKLADSADNLRSKARHLVGMAEDELDELKSVFQNKIEGLSDDLRERVLKLIAAGKATHRRSKKPEAWDY
jgi:gas vesicle protein